MKNDAMLCFRIGMKIKLQPNETPGWIGLLMEAMLSGYPGLHTWLSNQDLCSCLRLGVHLWTATQATISSLL
jgi:hypothetical protein